MDKLDNWEENIQMPEAWYPEFIRRFYMHHTGRTLNLENPRTFNEKIQWAKLYDRDPQRARLSDKYAVRDYIKGRVGEEHLIPLLGVWDNADDIDFDALPSRFVLKCTHGCAMNIIVKDKAKLDIAETRKTLDKWLKTNFAYKDLELQYKDIQPRVIVEEYIEDLLRGEPPDYKFFCFDGKPVFCRVDTGRYTDHRMDIYDMDWNRKSWKVGGHPNSDQGVPRPKNLEQMASIVRVLSEGIPFVRVDLFGSGDKIYCGEMTFTPASGCSFFDPPQLDEFLGRLYNLPEGKGFLGMPIKVSVVVPVYNVEKYLRECLDSIINQSLRDIEIICVDDGSTDNSPEILREYALANGRIQIYTSENKSPGAARNVGIDKARGEYIYFIDSDDLLKQEALLELFEFAQRNKTDVIYFNAIRLNELDASHEGQNCTDETFYERSRDYSEVTDGATLYTSMMENGDYRNNAVYQFARTGHITANNLRFFEGIYHEDCLYTFLCLMKANRAAHIAKRYYIRRVRPGSIMSVPKDFRHFYGLLVNCINIESFASENHYPDNVNLQIIRQLEELQNEISHIYSTKDGKANWLQSLDAKELKYAKNILRLSGDPSIPSLSSRIKGFIKFAAKCILPNNLYVYLREKVHARRLTRRGNKLTCPICEESFECFDDRKVAPEYLRYVVDKNKLLKEDCIRKNAICPKCGLNARFRLICLYLRRATDIFVQDSSNKRKVLHFAPEKALTEAISKNPNIEYFSADIKEGLAAQTMDIMDIRRASDEFDYVICSHVLEHVADDYKALSEIHRVLKPGGQAIIMVPLDYDSQTTLEKPETSEQKRIELYGQSDHVRLYGRDFPTRMEKVGFTVETFEAGKEVKAKDIRRYSLLTGETVYIGKKP